MKFYLKFFGTFVATFVATAGLLLGGLGLAQEVTITYWQYDFASKVDTIDQLIERFEAENPGIRVQHQTFPYEAYPQQVATSIPAGQGADVINLFYGWLPAWQEAGYLQPLPEEHFPTEVIEAEFIPMVQAAKLDGRYWALPTGVRSLALWYNQDIFDDVGVEAPPSTWAEFIEVAQAITVRRGDRYTMIGYGVAPDGQDHHLLREVLFRQFGTPPYSDDNREVRYDSPEGAEALTFYTDWVSEDQIGTPDFFPGRGNYRDGFLAGRIGMMVDGSFAIDGVRSNARFDWGVTELPVLEEGGERSNFGSFWMHGLTPLATGDRLEASIRFLEFITSEEAMQLWLENVGELPARSALLEDPALAEDPVLGPFLAALPYSHATFFADETEQRRITLDMINRVILQGVEPAESLRQAAEEEQQLLDSFWQGQD
ncbi:MAG: extracellular solute-binding protein [Deinococcota bacterium]|nr:extracellular solute-binding protein [Deinococcota bacterium]